MVNLSQDLVQLDLTQEQLKLCLIAIDVFHGLINNPVLQAPLINSIQHAEKFFGFSFDTHAAISDLSKFSDVCIGLTCDKIFEKYEELESLESLH